MQCIPSILHPDIGFLALWMSSLPTQVEITRVELEPVVAIACPDFATSSIRFDCYLERCYQQSECVLTTGEEEEFEF